MTPFQPRTLNADTSLSFLTQIPALRFGVPMTQPSPQVRLIRLDEINEERHQAYRQALANNDGHGFFSALEDSIITGPTLTNVNDFRAILVTADCAE